MTRRVNVVELFAGVGGFANGVNRAARQLDLDIVHTAAVDLDSHALAIYAANHRIDPQHTYDCDVAAWLDNIRYDLIPKPECDLIVGGPPCQGHSIANARTRNADPRNDLYYLMADAAIELAANAVVIENVPGVRLDERRVVQRTEQRLLAAGYHVSIGKLRADRLGAPQTRERHFVVARRDKWPTPVTDLAHTFAAPAKTAAEVLAGPVSGDPALQVAQTHGPLQRSRIDWLFDNDAYELPPELMPESKQGITHKAFKHIYGRIRPWLPMPTITTQGSPTHGRWVHPTERRIVNIAERAAAQEFPVEYRWSTDEVMPTVTELRRWVGNAIPASLAHAVTWAALEC